MIRYSVILIHFVGLNPSLQHGSKLGFLFFQGESMNLRDFAESLNTFENDLKSSNDFAGYSTAVLNLINDFYQSQQQKTKEDLIHEMLTYVMARSVQ